MVPTVEMLQQFDHGAPISPNKRYQTPLHFKDMRRFDDERRYYHRQEMRPSTRQRSNETLSTYLVASGVISRACSSNGDTRSELYSDIEKAATRNYSWLPYEPLFPDRDDETECTAEPEHVDWDGVPLGGEDKIAKEAAANTARIRLQSTGLDDPFISSARAHSTGQASDQFTLHSPRPERQRLKTAHSRGRSLQSSHVFLENGSVCHSPFQIERSESVRNYSRLLTPDCHLAAKRGIGSKISVTNSRYSDQAISYECVNGVCLHTTPRSAKDRKDGLSLPEIEARDLVKLDKWLHEHVAPAEAEFTSMEARPARPPPPVGGTGNSVRSISPQPPSAGKNHAFVSRYSWNVRSGGDDAPAPAPSPSPPPSPTPRRVPITLRRVKDERDVDTSDQVEPAWALLTEIIQGILDPTRSSSRPNSELYSGESDASRPLYAHHDYPPSYSTLQPYNRSNTFERNLTSPSNILGAPVSDSRCSADRSYRKKIGTYGKNAIKFMNLKNARMHGRYTCMKF